MDKCCILLNIIFLIALFSCEVPTDSSLALAQAEKYMNSRPDSAMLLLQNVLQPEMLSPDEYALWCLLMTQAEDKEGIEHTSDSLINIAVQYFDNKNNDLRKAQAYYCRGRVLMTLSQYDQAIVSLLKAEDFARNTTDYNLQARISNQLGDLYRGNSLYDKSLNYYQKANSYYIQDGYLKGIAYTLRDIGIAYEYLGQLDSSYLYLNQSLDMAKENDWIVLKRHVYKCLGNVYESMSLYPEAIKYIYSSMEITQNNDHLFSLFYSLGDLYGKMGQIDSALFYLNKSAGSSDLYTKCQSYRESSLLSYQRKDYKTAFELNEQYMFFRDSLEQIYQSEKIAEIGDRYNYQKAINEKNQLLLRKKDNEFFFLLVVISLLILLSIIVYVYQSHLHKKQLALQMQEQELQQNKQRLIDSRSEINNIQISLAQKESELQDKVVEMQTNMELIQTLITNKQQLEETYIQQNTELSKEIAILQGEIKEKISSIKNVKQKSLTFVRKYFENQFPQIKKLYDKKEIVKKYTDQDWESFIITFDDVYPDFISKLKKKCPKITKNEEMYCCLYVLGIKAEKISVVLDVETNTVSKYRKGIIKKNFLSDNDISLDELLNSML